MAIKSLTVTEDAYDALKTLKRGDESFSEAILRLSKEKIGLAAKFFGAIKMSPSEFNAWKAKMKERRAVIETEFKIRSKKIREKLA